MVTSHQHVPAGPYRSHREAASQHAAARQARDDGLRRVRTITWRIGLVSVAAAAIIGAKFANLTASLPNLSGDLSGNPASAGSSSSGIPASTGVSPATGGGVAISGGS